MSDPSSYYFDLGGRARPPFVPLAEEVHPDFGWLTANRARSRGRDVFTSIDTVVIHATAGFATAHAVSAWRKRRASAHWIIPDVDEPQHGEFVWATVAEAKAAYHVRDSIPPAGTPLGAGRNVNNRSLGIEIVNTQGVRAFGDPFSDWQVEATAAAVLYAWAKYPRLRHVVSHAVLDPSRRSDPGSNFPWKRFEGLVLGQAVLPTRNPVVSAEPPLRLEGGVGEGGGCCLP